MDSTGEDIYYIEDCMVYPSTSHDLRKFLSASLSILDNISNTKILVSNILRRGLSSKPIAIWLQHKEDNERIFAWGMTINNRLKLILFTYNIPITSLSSLITETDNTEEVDYRELITDRTIREYQIIDIQPVSIPDIFQIHSEFNNNILPELTLCDIYSNNLFI